ncbi:hypothetical protein AAFP30_11255 [Gordonia sp. CPCC 205515]|uniref:hypothetical protein n=1 Tax=Gordonia sp. CPCC 205515 TaxID=3140791 RepID=UPI003AF341FD
MPSTTAPTPADLLATARELTVTGLTRRQAFDTTRTIIDLSNTLGHLLSVCAAEMDRLGVAAQSGGKIKPLLIEMGLAPVVADRVLRIGRGLQRACERVEGRSSRAPQGARGSSIIGDPSIPEVRGTSRATKGYPVARSPP